MPYRVRDQYRQNYRERSWYDQNYRGDFRRGNFRGTQNYWGQNFRGGYRGSLRNDNFGRGRSRSRDRQFSSILGGMIEAVVDQDQVLEQVPIEIELDVSSVGNTIILLKIVQICQRQKRPERADAADAWLRGGQDSIESSCNRCLQKFD